MRPESYQALMRPGSVAIVGASDDGMKASGRVQRYLRKYRYTGSVYPVNARRDQVQGERAYPSLEAIEAPVDLVVVLTPAEFSLAAVESSVRLGVPAVIMIPSGFAELNAEGARLQQEIASVVRGTGTRVLGPNCNGVVSVRSRLVATINTGMDQDRFDLRDGGIAFLTQSGAMGAFIFNMSQTKRVGLGSMISTGNEMDITFPEMLEALIDDPEVNGVLGYIEGIRDGDAFTRALRRAAEVGKPLGFLKVGRSAPGKEAIASHTGALAGSDTIYSGVFQQYGVTRITGVEALADWAQMVDSGRSPSSNRLSIATTSGGGGVLVADYCEDLGIQLATWEGEWAQRLGAVLPGYASARNPIDMTGAGGNPALLRDVLTLMAEHPGTDIAFILIGNLERSEDELIEVLKKAHATMRKPLVVVWVGGSGRPAMELAAAGIPAYPDPARALQALAATLDAKSRHAVAHATRAPDVDRDRQAAARAIIAEARASGLRVLDEHRSKRLLRLYGMTIVEERVARDPEQAVECAEALGFPVAVKLLADNVAHKSDLGGVVLNLASAEAVRSATREVLARVPQEAGKVRVVVQRMVSPGLELLLGLKHDDAFGLMLAVGMGGTLTEVLEDVQLRRPPLVAEEVRGALAALRSSRLLGEFRGAPERDVDGVVGAALALSQLAIELADDVAELDINPLIVGARGEGATVVDAVVVPRPDERSAMTYGGGAAR